jgi:hypothetical protein
MSMGPSFHAITKNVIGQVAIMLSPSSSSSSSSSSIRVKG